jgi:hypothetical protein
MNVHTGHLQLSTPDDVELVNDKVDDCCCDPAGCFTSASEARLTPQVSHLVSVMGLSALQMVHVHWATGPPPLDIRNDDDEAEFEDDDIDAD